MDQRLTLKLGQRLILTPTLQQAIKLLELSKLELLQHIRQEITENPVLEELAADGVMEPQEAPDENHEKPPEDTPQATELPPAAPYPVNLDWESYAQYDSREGHVRADDSQDQVWYENVISTRESLQDHLTWQLHLTLDSAQDIATGEEIIGNIDDDGYLRAGTEEIGARLGIAPERVEAVLRVIQDFDPPGVGARDIRECLLVQAVRLPEPNRLAETIIRDHLKKLENHNYQQLAHTLKCFPEEVQQAAQVIAGLDPKPGSSYSTEDPEYIVPDLFITKEGNDYRVVLNDKGMPRLRISGYYQRLMRDVSLPAEAREYLNKKLSSALWLVKSIHQRQKTIFRVAESIVRHQREFLEHGFERLKPMVLRDVAADIGVHESTVSRVTNRKYAQTPQGLFELKFFFNSGIDQGAGLSLASTSVQTIIQRLVSGEDPARPLSDQAIAAMLHQKHGLLIARRTVAKYRQILRILPAGKRKRFVPAPHHHASKEGKSRCI